MKLSTLTLSKISGFITGDNKMSPYKKGPEIIELFNEVDILDTYKGGMPDGLSRTIYTKQTLSKINDSEKIAKILSLVFDSRLFAGTEYSFEECITQANIILAHDNYSIDVSTGKTIISGYDSPDQITVQPVFENIERSIIETINSAQFSIWVAVAWFTNRNIAQALFDKTRAGLNVRLLVLNDEINNAGERPIIYERIADTRRCSPKGAYQNIMHNKFCIIDLKTVIHGSYNYTNKANFNNESISIETSRQIAEQYASQFIKLYNEN